MLSILILGLIAVVVVRWAIMRDRLAQMQSSIAELSGRVDQQARSLAELQRSRQPVTAPVPAAAPVFVELAPVQAATPPPPPQPKPERPVAPLIAPPRAEPPPVFTPVPRPVPVIEAAKPAAPPREWEAVLGGSWLNKLGVFVLVIGLALLLRYSFTQFGPVGRVSICLAASLALLAAGAILESKERYRIFARGLLGGGWAGLYVTVYAMHAVEAARVIDSQVAGAALLLTVAAGMIVHSLRYRSQTVTGLAYFVAFGTLAITDMTRLPFLALVPLAASLLYVTHRFQWTRMAMLGLVATYAVVVIRGDTGSPLWQAQTMFAVYWLIFETFDVVHPEAWLLPINAAGFLGLSVMKWQTAAPDRLWMLLAATAVAYLLSAVARIRSGKWQGAATLTASLAAAAIFQKLDRQWIATALVVEAEIFYLSGIKLRAPYLRWLGTSLFGVEALRLLVSDMWTLPLDQWVPVASLDTVVFYANRALYAADSFYGFAGAGMLALVIGKKAGEPYRYVAWQAAAAGAFALGWWRRLFDFRLQGYLLLALGLTGTLVETPMQELPLAVAAGVCYAAALCALWSGADRFAAEERRLLRLVCGYGGAAALALAIDRQTGEPYRSVAWQAAAAGVFAFGWWRRVLDFRVQGYLLLALGLLGTAVQTPLPEAPLAVAAGICYAAALCTLRSAADRFMDEERDVVRLTGAGLAIASLMALVWRLVPGAYLGMAWMALALPILELGLRGLPIDFRRMAYAVAAVGAGRVWAFNVMGLHNSGAWEPRLMPLWAALLTYAIAVRARREEGGKVLIGASTIGLAFAHVALWALLPEEIVAASWAAAALALVMAARLWKRELFAWQSYAAAALAYALSVAYLPDTSKLAWPAAAAIACFYGAQLMLRRDGHQRLYFSLLATTLTTLLLYYRISGSMLTVACGIQGVILLASGFPLRDRVLRISGLALLLSCILKLFVWDLRHLETLPRIFSFIVLGVFLLGVSWIYTRFRERVAKFL